MSLIVTDICFFGCLSLDRLFVHLFLIIIFLAECFLLECKRTQMFNSLPQVDEGTARLSYTKFECFPAFLLDIRDHFFGKSVPFNTNETLSCLHNVARVL